MTIENKESSETIENKPSDKQISLDEIVKAEEVKTIDTSSNLNLLDNISDKSNKLNKLNKSFVDDELPELLPLEEYTTRFNKRYTKEPAFREIVHKYLELSTFSRFGLRMRKLVSTNAYNKKKNKIIENYSQKIREQLQKAVEIKKNLIELKKTEEDLKKRNSEVVELQDKTKNAAEKHYEVQIRQQQEFNHVEQKRIEQKNSAEEERKQREQEIQRKTDVENIVKSKLKEHLINNLLIQKNSNNEIVFNDTAVVSKLEDLFLKEIIEGIDKESGTGFYSSIIQAYNGLISHWAELEDLAELPNVDWIQSTILSRTKGYFKPTFPYLISAKGQERKKSSIDTAVALDTSGSMRDCGRFEVAQKATLAINALMRKLNPLNQTFLAHYNEEVYPTTSAQLMKSVYPNNGTRTDFALDWLLEKLKDAGPSIAYLITDGAPNSVPATIKVAEKFKQYPNIMLRIILIDGNKETEDNIREIGKAAGPKTKVIPVKNYVLGGTVIKDISNVIGEMQDIMTF